MWLNDVAEDRKVWLCCVYSKLTSLKAISTKIPPLNLLYFAQTAYLHSFADDSHNRNSLDF